MADSMQAYEELLNKANEYVNNYNPNETVNYNDQRFLDVKTEQAQKEAEINNTYNGMIENSNKFYQDQINASKEYAQKQSEIQQQNTDFMIEKINQEKEQSQKDYTKEQKGAYTDYQKQTNQYGVNAEQMAASGLKNGGYSESSIVSMYNTYQNRVAKARESYNQAVLNYNNSIKEAQLANKSVLAEIAYKALQQQLELSLQGFQYKNSLIEARIEQINQNNSRYDTKYQNVLAQINQEIANRRSQYNTYADIINSDRKLVEETRQFNAQMEEKERQRQQEREQWEREFAEKQRQFEKEYALAQKKTNSDSYGSSGLTVQDTPQITLNTNTINASSFMEGANNSITNMINIIKNSQVPGNPEKAKGILEQQLIPAINRMVDKNVIDYSQAATLFNRMKGYVNI